MKASIEEISLDPSPFIYELLRFADEQGASVLSFILDRKGLLFSYKEKNELAKEKQESLNKQIRSYALSNNFAKIFESLSLQEHLPKLEENETRFLFTFKPGNEKYYLDLKNCLTKLSYPNLFLNNVKKIFYEAEQVKAVYDKRVEYSENAGNISVDLIKMRKSTPADPEKMIDERLWLFSRTNGKGQKYSLGFFIDADEKLLAKALPSFSLFPLRESVTLNFIINAPFALKENGEELDASNKDNVKLLQQLAELGADSLPILKDLGIKSDMHLIDDGILKILPYDPSSLTALQGKLSYLVFYKAFLEKLKNSSLLPTSSGYTDKAHAYFSEDSELVKLFPKNILAALLGDEEADWLFLSIEPKEYSRNKALREYIQELVNCTLDASKILKGTLINNAITRKFLTKEFFEARSFAWLNDFYKWLLKDKGHIRAARNAPIFLDSAKKAFSLYDEKGKSLLVPGENPEFEKFLHPELLKSDNCKKVFEQITKVS